MAFIIWPRETGAAGNYRAQARDAARPLMMHRTVLTEKMYPISHFRITKVESLDSSEMSK